MASANGGGGNLPKTNGVNDYSSSSFKGWRENAIERKKPDEDVDKLKNLLLQKQKTLGSCNLRLLPDGGQRIIQQIEKLKVDIEKQHQVVSSTKPTEPVRQFGASISKDRQNDHSKKPVKWAGPPAAKPVIWARPPDSRFYAQSGAPAGMEQFHQVHSIQKAANHSGYHETFRMQGQGHPKTYSKKKTFVVPKPGSRKTLQTEPHSYQNFRGLWSEENRQRFYGGRMTENRIANVQSVTETAIIKLHKSLDNCPGPEVLALDPPELVSSLMPHQKQALAWMLWREQQDPSGGVLADDMGLGKTLTLISLVLHKIFSKPANLMPQKEWLIKKGLVKSRGTLVVCPASLLLQWEKEVGIHCKAGALDVYLYHGPNREKDIHKLASYNMVITTYTVLSKESGDRKESKEDDDLTKASAVQQIVWERVILDEAHTIKNSKSKCCNAVCLLRATHRWALTGTPIHNDVLDVYALLRFLRVSPFDELKVWKKWVGNNSSQGKERLSTLMKSLLLRRTKDQLDESGKPLVSLPTKSFTVHTISLSEKEREVYNKLDEQIRATLNNMIRSKAGGTTKDGPSRSQALIFTLLLRLQQTCNHLSLLIQSIKEPEDADELTSQMSSLTVQDSCSNSSSKDVAKELGSKQGDNESKGEDSAKLKEGTPKENSDDDELSEKLKSLSVKDGKAAQSSEVLEMDLTMYKNDKDFDSTSGSTKMDKLLEELKAISKLKDKSVIVSQWTSMLNIVAYHLKKNQIAYVVIQGDVSIKNRMSSLNSFNDPKHETQVMLVSLKAGGVGLNLTGGNHLFLLDVHWNPALESQACDRVFRFGQTKPVTIHRFICKDTVEEKILNLQSKKLELARTVLSGDDKAHARLTLDDLKQLFCVRTN